jgi:quercetin dioxygenase-like cupin family protein
MSERKLGAPGARRVVTGHGQDKAGAVMLDALADNIRVRPNASSTTVWCTEGFPVRMQSDGPGPDLGARAITTGTPPRGTRFMIMDLMPGCEGAMHRTDTLDYVAVLEGEVEMRLETSTITLRQGEVLVQQGTAHAWLNRSDKPARMAIVLIEAEPLGEGFPPGRKETVTAG